MNSSVVINAIVIVILTCTSNFAYAIDVIPTPYVHCISEQDIADLASATDIEIFKQILVTKTTEDIRCSVVPIGAPGVRVRDITPRTTKNGQKYYCYRDYDRPDIGEKDCVLNSSIRPLREYLTTTTDDFVIEFNNEKMAFAKCLNGTTVIVDKATPQAKMLISFNYTGIEKIEQYIKNTDLFQSIRNGCVGKGVELEK